MKILTVNASKSYDIIIGKGLLEKSGELIGKVSTAKKAVIITDDIVDGLYSKKVGASLEESGIKSLKFVFPNGEKSKSHAVLLELYSFLVKNDVTRGDLLIALGGGVTGDLVGFCAATYLRGVDFVQIPTTLLAQVDSSVGGKTAVNIPEGKNLIGAFKQPLLVISDVDTLSTLSDEIFADGMGEVVKYGMIRSYTLFEKLENGKVKDDLEDIIYECVDIKRAVVENDEFDTGERMILNFGHTLGHALEKKFNFSGISHGKAVAVGMMLVTEKCADESTANRLRSCLIANNLPVVAKAELSELYELSVNDKKRLAEKIRIIVCKQIGKAEIITMSMSEFRSFLGV